MAYSLQAFVGDADVLSPVAGSLPIVPLPQNKVLVPLTKSARTTAGIPCLPLTDDGHADVPPTLMDLGRTLSALGRIVYLEAEFFGGDGAQAMFVATRGELTRGPEVHSNAINDALRELGVASADGDEFDALGLGGHRDTDDWCAPTARTS